MHISHQVIELLDQQVGVISRQQLLASGYRGAQVDGMLRRGHLERMEHGVYRRPGSGKTPHQEELSALLRCGDRARLTGPRLLGHLGLEGFSDDDPFTVLVPAGRRIGSIDHPVRRDWAPQRHKAAFGPVAGTTPARVLVEMAMDATRSDGDLVLTFDRLRWRGVMDRERLALTVDDLPGHPGAVRIRRLLDLDAATQESPGERRMANLLGDLEPPLEFQVWVAPDLRVDALWRDVSLVVEYDGHDTHGDPRDRARDTRRHERLRAMGYEVLVVVKDDLRYPQALRGRLLAARRRRQAASA